MNKFFSSSLRRNSFVSGVCKPLSMVVSYIYIPIVLNYLGIEKYGVWSTILTILSWITYFDIGIGNGLRNRLAESIAENRNNGKKLVSSAYAFISVVMILLIVVFSIFAHFINWNRLLGVANIDENLRLIVVLAVVFVALNFILSVCKNVLYAYQKAGYVSVMELSTQIMNLLGVLVFSSFTHASLFCMTFVYGTSMLVVNIAASIAIYLRHSDLFPTFEAMDFNIGRNLTSLGIKFFIIQICALVLYTTDSLIISMLYGASDVTPYSTVNKIFTAVSSVYVAFLAPVWSAVTKAKSEKNFVWLKNSVKKLNLLMLPFFTGAIALSFVFKPLTTWWLKKELFYTQGLISFGCLYACLTIWCNTYAYIANGLELMKMSMITAVVQAIVNIPVSLFFALFLGMKSTGVLAGTIFSMCISAVAAPIAVKIAIKQMEEKQ